MAADSASIAHAVLTDGFSVDIGMVVYEQATTVMASSSVETVSCSGAWVEARWWQMWCLPPMASAGMAGSVSRKAWERPRLSSGERWRGSSIGVIRDLFLI
ncbi:uncharacterized protein [Triticum aestivum]|uniref:uncharacterized protein n=1 Tax=Triticum aestivum TaxID=4565 RepID=UPI001D010B40|nr:uncharacterized protein LOC123124221 [Triticum aestivum]